MSTRARHRVKPFNAWPYTTSRRAGALRQPRCYLSFTALNIVNGQRVSRILLKMVHDRLLPDVFGRVTPSFPHFACLLAAGWRWFRRSLRREVTVPWPYASWLSYFATLFLHRRLPADQASPGAVSCGGTTGRSSAGCGTWGGGGKSLPVHLDSGRWSGCYTAHPPLPAGPAAWLSTPTLVIIASTAIAYGSRHSGLTDARAGHCSPTSISRGGRTRLALPMARLAPRHRDPSPNGHHFSSSDGIAKITRNALRYLRNGSSHLLRDHRRFSPRSNERHRPVAIITGACDRRFTAGRT